MTESRILCRVEDIPDAGACSVRVESSTGGFPLVLLRQGEQVFAYHNECPHAGRSLEYAPGKFLVKDGRIICAAHGAVFAVTSGECLGGPCRNGLVAVPVEIADGRVLERS